MVAWERFAAWEPQALEVGIGGSPRSEPGRPSPPRAGTAPGPTRAVVHPAWWLLPFFLGFIGGLIAWTANRRADPRMANALLIAGIVSNLLGLLLLRAAR